MVRLSFGLERRARFGRASAMSIAVFILSGASGARAAQIFDFAFVGISSFAAPLTGVYDITAYGAQGGAFNFYSAQGFVQSGAGGLGAEIEGAVYLTAGQQLTILVGSAGLAGQNINPTGGGGGGGAFVALGGAPLVVAGGGGGASFRTNGGAGLTGNSGGYGGGSGGAPGGNGGGGGRGGFLFGGGGGAGFYGNGGNGSGSGGGGFSFLDFGWGGFGQAMGGIGGGGGGGGNSGGFFGGGGGGGYSGGGGGGGSGFDFFNASGGGGGSFLAPIVRPLVEMAGVNSGDSRVQIAFAPGATPGKGLPSLVLLAIAAICAKARGSRAEPR